MYHGFCFIRKMKFVKLEIRTAAPKQHRYKFELDMLACPESAVNVEVE